MFHTPPHKVVPQPQPQPVWNDGDDERFERFEPYTGTSDGSMSGIPIADWPKP